MSPWIQELREFVSQPKPRFRCYAAGRRGLPKEYSVANLQHELAGPASDSEVRLLQNGFGRPFPGDFLEFFTIHNGVTLFQDTIQNPWGFHTTGIRVTPVSEWSPLKSQAEDWLDSLDEEQRAKVVPAWVKDAVVFAEVPNSGNCFAVVLSGESRGEIVYFNHDGLDFKEYAESLAQFFKKITSEPAEALYALGCYARYTDGKTKSQWIPEAYASGMDGGVAYDQQSLPEQFL